MISTGSTGISQTVRDLARASMLQYAVDKLAFAQFAKPYELKENEGDTYTWYRPTRIAPSLTNLESGVTPGASQFGMDKVTADASQYGAYVLYTDRVAKIPEVKLLDIGAKLLGENMSLVMDLLHRNNLDNNATTIIYANGRTSRGAVTSSDVITGSDIRKIRRKLTVNVAPRLSGGAGSKGRYVCIAHPNMEYDLQGLAEFTNPAYYQNQTQISTGDVPQLFAIEFIFTTLGTVKVGAGSSSADVYRSFIFGEEAFGGVDLKALQAQMITKPFGSAGSSDPLEQRATQGWKDFVAQAILNANWVVAYECAATG